MFPHLSLSLRFNTFHHSTFAPQEQDKLATVGKCWGFVDKLLTPLKLHVETLTGSVHNRTGGGPLLVPVSSLENTDQSVGPLVHPFCCDYQSSSLFDCLTLEYRWLTKLPTSAKAKTRHSDTRLPYWTGVQGSKCWHVVGRTVKKRLYQQRKGESLEKKDTHESPTAIG